MPTATIKYFHSASLKQLYIEELASALQNKRLQPSQHDWLLGPTLAPNADDPDPVRVDHIILGDGSITAFELSAALLFSHTLSADAQIYLFTLAHGIEVFEDRHVLLAALRARFCAGDANTVFEYERVDGDPFKAQMFSIVDQQVERIRQLTEQFKLTPTLYDVATASVAKQLRELLAHMPVDPATHLLQITSVRDGDADSIPLTRTLAQAAFDDCRNVVPDDGLERRFLDAQGLPASAIDSELFVRAFANTAQDVPQTYRALLQAFWDAQWCSQRTRRDLAIESYGDSLRREVYGHRHDRTLDSHALGALLPLLQSPASQSASAHCQRLVIKVGDSAELTLAGTFVVPVERDLSNALLWFSPAHTLMEFADLATLSAHLQTQEGREQLCPALALEDRSALQKNARVQVFLRSVDQPILSDCIDSIIALQARNLRYVTELTCEPQYRMAMVDDALDIRQLLDPRQLQFSASRWRQDAPFTFDSVWLTPRIDDQQLLAVQSAVPGAAGVETVARQLGDPVPGSENPTPTSSWLEQTQSLDLRADRLRALGNVLFDCAEQALQHSLCVLATGAVRARDVQVQWLESAPVDPSDVETSGVQVSESQRTVVMDLVSLLLECVSGHRSTALVAGAQARLEPSISSGRIQIELVTHLLEKNASGFIDRYIQRFTQSRGEFLRQGNLHLQPSTEALGLREDAMRLDLALAKRQTWIDDQPVALVRQVLERPVRSLRTRLAAPVTEVFSVSFAYNDQPEIVLGDTLVLWQPLNPDSPLMLWCCALGWRQYSSLPRLLDMFDRELHGANRERWLELLAERDRKLLRSHLLNSPDNRVGVRLYRVDGHAIGALQQGVLSCGQQDLRQLCLRAIRDRFEAGLFTLLANATEMDVQLGTMLDGLSVRVANSLFEELLPPWVTSAPLADLMLYNEIWRRYYLASDGGRDFLFDVPLLQVYAHDQLSEQMNQDFPGHQLDPDQITMTSRRYVTDMPAVGGLPSGIAAATIVHSESLTDFAINRFAAHQDAVLSFEADETMQGAHLLTLDYLERLVRRLDVGARYVRLLRRALTSEDADYALRNRLFVEQLPPALLAIALPQRLRGKLSTRAYEFISRVVDMPDGIAREPVDGTRVILSPLQLIADQGMTPDTVCGLYLICPAPPEEGPVVLYALYHSAFVFREYSNRAALMDDVRNDESLQQLLLERVDPEVRRRYANGGLREPHLPFSVGLYDVPFSAPGPVTVGLSEIRGNALQYIFDGTIKLLLDMGVSNTVTNQQEDQAGRAFLATLGLEQGLMLLPGKLGAFVTLWQSHSLVRASVASASGRRWGEALSEFSAALGVMVTAREQTLEEQSFEDPPATTTAFPAKEGEGLPSAFTWRSTVLNAEQRLQLRGLEASRVALSDMRHDQLLNLYRDKSDDTPYAVVSGKVYQVKPIRDEGTWMIVGSDGVPGPKLALDSHQRWQLDLGLRLRGGGGASTKLKATKVDYDASDVIAIEASGMPAIRLLYRDRARRIGQAHLHAKRCLENCLDNLNVHQRGAPLDDRVTRIIGDFFGTARPDRELLTRTESAIKTLFDAIMDASLSPFSSPRIVVGSSRPGYEFVTAFVIKTDPQKRVFLTELFFNVPHFPLSPQAVTEGFQPAVHYRAANLIHELSHLTLDTHDIAYLEAMAPYPDLLPANSAEEIRLRAHIERLHGRRFSHRSDRESLFTLRQDGQRRDITVGDERGLELVLRLTGTDNLNNARDVFLTDVKRRSRVMLNNADSLTLLVLLLGRTNFSAPVP